jgi:4-hydroxy-2-oxoglutarate aldolase
MPTLDLAGIFVPLTSPFGADGELRLDALAAQAGSCLAAGARGLVATGTNGEAALLDPAERDAVWQAVRAAVPSDRIFVAGAGAESTRGAIAACRRAASFGADAALVLTPHAFRGQVGPAQILAHYRAIADASPIPIVLYNLPGFTGVDLDAATILALAEHANVAGIKDSAGQFPKLAEIVRFAPARFAVLAGSAAYLHPALAIGARGGVPALGACLPEACVRLYELSRAGRTDEARALQLALARPNGAIVVKLGVPGVKAALDERGRYGGPPRAPLAPLGPEERAKVRTILDEAGLLG